MDIRTARLDDPLVAPLLSGLSAEYYSRYGANDEMKRAAEAEFDPPTGLFVVIVDDAEGVNGPITVAGGGFRRFSDEVCEVKRMWTHPDYRRRGLADRVLSALEEAAAGTGYRRLVLETGPRQPEAAALYHRRGYRRIAAYGHYEEALAFETSLVPHATL